MEREREKERKREREKERKREREKERKREGEKERMSKGIGSLPCNLKSSGLIPSKDC
jgi:hypothetical protein